MGLRMVLSRLSYILKSGSKMSCHGKSYSRHCKNRYAGNSRDRTTTISGIYFFSTDSPVKCWQCDYPFKSEFFCQKCKALQEPPEKLNYFQIIGVEEDYDVNGKVLQQKYRALQNILHPDRFSNRTDKEKQISETMSSLINKAYNTLSDPLERGLYMLSLKNLSIPEGTTTDLNPQFLMEIMERNEKVDEASENPEKIIHLINENNAILDKLALEVSEAFGSNDAEKGKRVLIRMKYYASLQTRLKKLKQELGIVD